MVKDGAGDGIQFGGQTLPFRCAKVINEKPARSRINGASLGIRNLR
jgi:hypothetical protein